MAHILRLIIVVMVLAVSPAYAASLEQIFVQAQEAYKAGRYAESAGLFTQAADALLKAKETAKAQMVLGNAAIALIKGEDHNGAIQIYERVLKIPGQTAPDVLLKTYKNMIVSHGALGHQALKIQAIERMLKAIPKLPPSELANAHAQLGDAYRALELYAKAESDYAKALFLLPQDGDSEVKARTLTAMGLCQGNLGDFAKAETSLTQARAIAATLNVPLTLAESDSNLGILYWERGDYPQALQLLNTALGTEKKNVLRRNEGVERNNLGLVEKSIGRYNEAMNFFEESLVIAREVGNKKDQAIALANRALLNRMTGKLNEARADYRAAMALYEEVGFQEGKAGALLGIGKIAELEDRNLEVALNNYKEALDIYTKIAMPRSQAESYLQIGGVFKRTSAPGRTTRDLVFDDAPVAPKMDKAQALAASADAYSKALQLAEAVSSKEMIWAARQGIGFALLQHGKLEQAFDQYKQAIDMVSRMRTNLKSVALLGEYMAGKEDLYGEALEVCAKLYEKTKDKKYIDLQMQWDETLRNEIQKASATLVQMEFVDKGKQELYKNMLQMSNRLDKAESAIPIVATLPANASPEAKAVNEMNAVAAKEQKAAVQKLEGDYQKLLAQWKKDYKDDAVMFESVARVDMQKVQKALKPDQALLQYILLQNNLIIIATTSNTVGTYMVNVGAKEIETAIKQNFLIEYLEGYRNRETATAEREGLQIASKLFTKFYSWFVEPAKNDIKDKKRLYVAASGFIAQLPFVALVSNNDGNNPRFLVEDYEISNIRPSFIDSLTVGNEKQSTKKVLGVGDPRNKHLKKGLPPLEGASAEVENFFSVLQLQGKSSYTAPQFRENATETWWRDELLKNNYEILYFATHGMPFSDTYYSYYVEYIKKQRPIIAKKAEGGNQNSRTTLVIWDSQLEFIRKTLPGLTPMNGYLFMEASENDDGLLTIKEISELPEKAFSNTRFAVLSACNTAVTFAPKSLFDNEFETAIKAKEVEINLRNSGWVPGADQISFTDIFMRRGVNNVYGTLWFADDKASSYIMTEATKEIYIHSNNNDVVAGYSNALRKYIANARKNEQFLGDGRNVASNPYYWACGAIFGK